MNMSHATGRQDVSFYNLLNNIEQRNTERGQYSYGYDDLNRLLTSNVSGTALNDSESFDYDGVGNRTTYQHNANPEQSWAYNDANQLQQISDGSTPLVDYTYDANGHQIKKTTGGVDTHFVYNHEERLIRVEDHVRNVIAAYRYNPFGHRLSKTVGGVTTYFLYNHQGMVGEYDASGTLQKEYHYTPDSTWMTDPLFQRDSGQVYFYQNDHIGTPQRLLSQSGSVVWQADYRAFGQATVNTALVSNNLRFPGQYFDGETGLHHNYFRDYDPGLGRYVQGDPIGLAGGVNWYGYVGGNPLSDVDPLGLWGLPGAIAGAACAAISGKGACGIVVGFLSGGFGILGGMIADAVGGRACNNNEPCPLQGAVSDAVGAAAGGVAGDAVNDGKTSANQSRSKHWQNNRNVSSGTRVSMSKSFTGKANRAGLANALFKSGPLGCLAGALAGSF